MRSRAATGPIDELAGILADQRARTQTLEVIAHRHRFDLDPTVWTAPAFLNAWANFGGVWQVAQYRRVGDVVQIRGTVNAGVIGAAVFVLPVGFRPPADMAFSVPTFGTFGTLVVTGAGNVIANTGSNVAFWLTAQFSVTT